MPTTEILLGGVIMAALCLYAIFGGADFGGGVWDLFASGPRKVEQRALIEKAIGPIWEANHVWLILAVVLLFSAFPTAFAAISIALHVPLTLFLIGVVFRGSAFTFRAYDDRHDHRQKRWGLLFSLASVASPLLLGVLAGTVASGEIHVTDGVVTSGYFAPWLRPFPSWSASSRSRSSPTSRPCTSPPRPTPRARLSSRRTSAVAPSSPASRSARWLSWPSCSRSAARAHPRRPHRAAVDLAAPPRHGGGGDDGVLRAVAAPTRAGAPRRGRADDADPPRLGGLAVSLSARSVAHAHERCGQPAHARALAHRARRRVGAALSLALRALSGLQGEQALSRARSPPRLSLLRACLTPSSG